MKFKITNFWLLSAIVSMICFAIVLILAFDNNTLSKKYQEEQNDTNVETTQVIEEQTTKVVEIKNETKAKKKKTTKKKKVVKKTKTKYENFNIKYNRNEIVNYVYQEVVRRWGEDHWQAVYNIISRESGFNPNSVNKSSGACGLFQAHPCNNTIKNGYTDYKTNWKTQVRWGLDYITYRYKTPNKAWSFWQKHHWY